MVLMAAVEGHDHHRTPDSSSPSEDSPPPAPAAAPPPPPPSRTRLHSFSFPTLSWGTHRLLRCSKNPASSPPPAAPDTPSPDKEKAGHRSVDGVGGGSPQRTPQRPWNLRTRRSATAAPRPEGSDDAADTAPERAPPPAAAARKRAFSILLSKEEIAEDFKAIRGTRPPRRPKKRPRTVQRQLDLLYPGFCLADVTPETYKIEER
ncbi:scavenger receptor class F member 2-like [Oryza brachyantha]|uniref:scavenger receptor class F member 2-like n=1 Tax=Oryza brachyantha TaxID=4533 RepID=UPI001ADC4089|nr:scavenger receptor class F member 2-like [Oryza brachyantha]